MSLGTVRSGACSCSPVAPTRGLIRNPAKWRKGNPSDGLWRSSFGRGSHCPFLHISNLFLPKAIPSCELWGKPAGFLLGKANQEKRRGFLLPCGASTAWHRLRHGRDVEVH